jgi:hypothetical protein
MNVLSINSATKPGYQAPANVDGRSSLLRAALRPLAFAVLIATLSPVLHAQTGTLVRDTMGPNMDGVKDVTGGMTYLLQDDDLTMVQLRQDGSGNVTTSLLTMDTSKSQPSNPQPPISVSQVNPNGQYETNTGLLAGMATGRMFQTKSDVIAILNEGDGPSWQLSLIDPLTGWDTAVTLHSSFRPQGQVFTQVVMGKFLDNKLDDPLVSYCSVVGASGCQWGMKVFTAGQDLTQEGPPVEGPEFYSPSNPAPHYGNIVTGDFNGDGVDEIAVLLNDNQTVAFYQVNPTTLAIQPMLNKNGQPATVKLAQPLLNNQAALVAGRFQNAPNADLVAVGSIGTSNTNGNTIYYIQTVDGSGSFNPSLSSVIGSFPDKSRQQSIIARGAPILFSPQQTNQQLLIGISWLDNGLNFHTDIQIGSFNSTYNFQLQSETDLNSLFNNEATQLYNMQVGNFNHYNADGVTLNPALQLETYTREYVGGGSGNNWIPQITIFDLNPSNPIPGDVTNWLGSAKWINGSALDLPGNQLFGIVMPGDIEGRSLRLGSPDIVTIPEQIQPDIVLGLPPMHADWIYPNNQDLAKLEPGCDYIFYQVPCLVNLTIHPKLTYGQDGFTTQFQFSSGSTSSEKQVDTTSWGVAVKETSEFSATYGDGLSSVSVDVTNTSRYAHDHNVQKTYDTYTGNTNRETASTGFADLLFFTRREMNIYYYPVLGQVGGNACPPSDPQCPTYVEFSVPDHEHHSMLDGTLQEWYQPVHEPGNALSYPWSKEQLQDQFSNKPAVVLLSSDPPPCKLTDTSSQSYQTSWNFASQGGKSTGSTNSFSDDLSVSTTAKAGIKGIDAAKFKFGVDIAASGSLSTLNESISSLSVSDGITMTKPFISGIIAQCCSYSYGAYIFGLQNTNHPPGQVACMTSGQTDCLPVNDPDGNLVNVTKSGPLFVGYLADVLGNKPNGLSCSGNNNWWASVYNVPDVGVNHPARWSWSTATQTVSFNSAGGNPLDTSFYWMKGFFITQKGQQGNSPSLSEAVAGEQLSLTTRVYNYSLVDTTAPVHVRIYGQLCCSAGQLIGNAFLIGENVIPAIPGFKSDCSGNECSPNWTTTSMDFDTTNYAGDNLAFWVVVWMQNGSGDTASLVGEMPDHGLTSLPGSLQQITDVPIEQHSNNIGLYGHHRQFYIIPAASSLGAELSGGSLQSITLTTSPKVLLEQRTKLVANVQATGGPADHVTIAYYDGDPSKSGTLLDVQSVAHIDAGASYYHRAFFTPESCGVHTLYADAWLANLPEIQASTTTNVTIHPADLVQALITSTQAANISNKQLGSNLLALLDTALEDFQQNKTEAGNAALSAYMQQLALASGNSITASNVTQLTGQAGVVLGCGSSGFSVVASPSSATVSAGSSASYALAVTPIGGFTGKVSFACLGAPAGIECSFPVQSITLNGSSQSSVTITVRTTSPVTVAGMTAGLPSGRSQRMRWLLVLLLAALAIASLPRARMRQTILGCVIALVLLGSASGCGSNGSTTSIQPGTYPFTLQATSGNTVQNTLLILIVK